VPFLPWPILWWLRQVWWIPRLLVTPYRNNSLERFFYDAELSIVVGCLLRGSFGMCLCGIPLLWQPLPSRCAAGSDLTTARLSFNANTSCPSRSTSRCLLLCVSSSYPCPLLFPILGRRMWLVPMSLIRAASSPQHDPRHLEIGESAGCHPLYPSCKLCSILSPPLLEAFLKFRAGRSERDWECELGAYHQ